MPYCPQCGEQVKKEDEFCLKCGNSLGEKEVAMFVEEKRRLPWGKILLVLLVAAIVGIAIYFFTRGGGIEDDFESYAVGTFPSAGGWEIVWSGAGSENQTIVDTVSVSPTKSLQLLGSSGYSAGVKRMLTWTEPILNYELYVRLEELKGSTDPAAKFGFFNENIDSGQFYAYVVFADDGVVRAGTELPYTISADVWYKVRVVLDTSNNTYDVWINDTLIGENCLSGNSSEINAFALVSDHAGVKVYYDDVKVFATS